MTVPDKTARHFLPWGEADLPAFLERLSELNDSNDLNYLDVRALSPIALAYVGDAVYELYIRTRFLWPLQRIKQYHQCVVAQVRAEQQAQYLTQWEPHLTLIEKDVVRRGRNASPKQHRRVDAKIYQQATGFEALIGYLYIADWPRLQELLGELKLDRSNG
jgi:ribonuclease-3 family protein